MATRRGQSERGSGQSAAPFQEAHATVCPSFGMVGGSNLAGLGNADQHADAAVEHRGGPGARRAYLGPRRYWSDATATPASLDHGRGLHRRHEPVGERTSHDPAQYGAGGSDGAGWTHLRHRRGGPGRAQQYVLLHPNQFRAGVFARDQHLANGRQPADRTLLSGRRHRTGRAHLRHRRQCELRADQHCRGLQPGHEYLDQRRQHADATLGVGGGHRPGRPHLCDWRSRFPALASALGYRRGLHDRNQHLDDRGQHADATPVVSGGRRTGWQNLCARRG